jgi:hypothetical protein
MKMRTAAFAAALLATALVPAAASAHPIESGELYVPWGNAPGKENAVQLTRGAVAAQDAQASGLELVGNVDKDGTTNSDLAFWGDLAYAGNYNGFRILNIRGDQPTTVVDFACRGPQNDVSVYELGGRRYLFQSIDSAQTVEDCSSADAPIVNGGRVGYEGVRVFDVTHPSSPQFVDMIQTACGSHTHTLIPGDSRRDDDDDDDDRGHDDDDDDRGHGDDDDDRGHGDDDDDRGRGHDDDDDDDDRARSAHKRDRGTDTAYIYVASYPLTGSSVTPPGAVGPGEYKPCVKPHKKISIIEVSSKRGEFRSELKEQPLADDTTSQNAFDNFQACHDFQVLGEKDIMLASCAGDGQLWDVSDPWNPTTNVPGKYTLIKSPGGGDTFEFIHSGVFSWDGKVFAMMDETGGGVGPHCFGSASTDGFYYFYKTVKPGRPAPPLEARYTIPRAQGTNACVSHNATVIPVKHRDVMTAAYYHGGVSVVDFSDLDEVREIAYADITDATGIADEWSSYWYNGRVFSNSGLGRNGATGNRGVDVFRLSGRLGREVRRAERWKYSNPQTQEAWQAP